MPYAMTRLRYPVRPDDPVLTYGIKRDDESVLNVYSIVLLVNARSLLCCEPKRLYPK